MKKVAAVFVSIGVILVIAGLVMVGIFGGEAIKNINWKDMFSGNHNLDSANYSEDKTAEELSGLTNIDINVDRYTVYVLPTDDNKVSVKYVTPLDEGVDVQVEYIASTLSVTETDNLGSLFFGGLFGSKRFIAVYVPQTELFTQASLTINAETAGIKVKNVAFSSVKCTAKTGGVSLLDINAKDVYVSATTGSVNVNQLDCNNLTAKTTTGSINVNETEAKQRVDIEVNTGSVNCHVTAGKLTVDADTGSVNFTATSDDIKITTDTGSVNGTVIGNKSEYQISVRKDTGKSNIQSQNVPNADKFLSVEVDTGSINIHFNND